MLPVTRHFRFGVVAALRNLHLVLLQSGVDLLATVCGALPLLLAMVLFIRQLGRVLEALPPTLQPVPLIVAGMMQYLGSARFLLPVFGVALSGALLVAGLRYAYFAGAFGVLGDDVRRHRRPEAGTFMDSLTSRFHASVVVGVMAFFAALLSVVWATATLGAGFQVWQSLTGRGSAWAVVAAFALAAAMAAAVMLSVSYEAVLRVALVRTVALAERPLVAIFEGMMLVLRQPLPLVLLGLLLLVAQVTVALTVALGTGTAAMVPAEAASSGWAVAARMVGMVIQIGALAAVAVVAQGAIAALVLDEAGEMDPPPEDEELLPIRPRVPAVVVRRAVVVRPTEPVAVAAVVRPTAPAEESPPRSPAVDVDPEPEPTED